MLSGPPSIYMAHNFDESVPERKITFGGVCMAACSSGRVPGLVEDGAQVICRIEEDARQRLWDLSEDANFVDFLSRLRLFIDDFGVWSVCDKVIDHGFEVMDVVLGALECQPSAVEKVSHARKVRPNERARVSTSNPSFRDDTA
jgi:hypothetical protein